ncbi:MAG: DUF320 domain-containing protein, partial [Thermoleophilia bacterium]|nr:DUF320 domain-containing protein [Thermoleophilia bacterium]
MRKLIVSLVAATVMAAATATGASAQNQTGLVNVNVSGNTIQLPVALAANVCDVTVAVLVADLRDDGNA